MLKNAPLLRCLAIYREMPWRFALTSVLMALVNGSLAWQQWLVGRAVTEVQHGLVVIRQADGGFDFHRAWHWLILLTAVAAVRGTVQYGTGIIALFIGQELLTIIRVRILDQIQRLDLAYHWAHGVGEIITRTTRDSDKVRDALITFWRQVFETGLVVLASAGILIWYAPLLGIVPLLLTATGLSILVFQTDRLVVLDRRVGAAYDAVNQDLSEGIHGVRVIKAFGLEALRVERFEDQVRRFTQEARVALVYASRRIPLPQIVVASSHVWVLAYGAVLVGRGHLQIGELVAALLAANALVLRVEGIAPIMQTFADARASAARIWELLDAEPGIRSGHAVLPPGPLGVRLTHVRVTAPRDDHGEGNDTLRDVSLCVRPGEIVALVGATGVGKSILMGLLPRLVEANCGTVAIGSDDHGWQDVRDLDQHDLRRRVHVVPQESFLFSDTLAANLRLARPQATEDELRAALQLAAAEEILDGLPDGFQTLLGDRGLTLSGGQRQRLCLARALLARAAVLGLDDATSALDAQTERTVLDNIRRLPDVTLLIVSSKLSTILMADRVLLLADGRIADQGTHADLADRNPVYRDLMGI